jgi:hypothetical protein
MLLFFEVSPFQEDSTIFIWVQVPLPFPPEQKKNGTLSLNKDRENNKATFKWMPVPI